MDKTEAMDDTGRIPQSVKPQSVKSGFKWPKEGITHLGIYIPSSLQNLYGANYSHMIRRISSDLERWSMLLLSLLGRVKSIRMNVLPRLLYFFQMLPVEIPKSTFDNLDKIILKWQKRLKTLQLSKPDGGLKLN